MAISNQMNSYQSLNTYQQPVQRQTKDSVQQAMVLPTQSENQANEEVTETQADRDDTRASLVNYTATQSKKSQVEIYLSVATDGAVSSNSSDTANILESLRNVQKQNNTIQAFAAYQENQNNLKSAFL